jgi:hypothetical protein
MSHFLCTFSGKYGDILWSLATAKFIAEKIVNGKVDFAVMPYYGNLCEFLMDQMYIDRAFVIPDWVRTNSNYGDQPWQPPKIRRCTPMVGTGWSDYEREWHLTYRGHPGINAPNMPLIDFIAYQQGIQLQQPVLPFLSAMHCIAAPRRYVTMAFNEQYEQQKLEFQKLLVPELEKDVDVVDVGQKPWMVAAAFIKEGLVHIGCRSACWVIANGLDKEVFTFEPHPSRHRTGHLGNVFSCPYGREKTTPFAVPTATAAYMVAEWVRERMMVPV